VDSTAISLVVLLSIAFGIIGYGFYLIAYNNMHPLAVSIDKMYRSDGHTIVILKLVNKGLSGTITIYNISVTVNNEQVNYTLSPQPPIIISKEITLHIDIPQALYHGSINVHVQTNKGESTFSFRY